MSKFSILKEFFQFLGEQKKWWLIPIALFLVLLGTMVVFSQGSVIAPFVYTIF